MSPGEFSGEVWHSVLWEFLVEEITTADELWTVPAPARVSRALAINTSRCAIGSALGGAVVATAGATCVE